jgi:tRNA(fMet)-specific endonuclease VapC
MHKHHIYRLTEFVAGLLFGIGLLLSGMTDPGKVLGFLDLAGAWDPSLAFVMGGAVLVGLLAFGVAKSESVRNRQALEMFLAPLTILPFDASAAWVYGELRSDLERRGTPIGSMDTIIAAHALSQQAVLITNNTREFSKVPGLQLDNWVFAA